jgi:hypothetical protein
MYKFLDEELPSDYYKDLIYGLHMNLQSFKDKDTVDMEIESGNSQREVMKLMEVASITKSKIKIYQTLCLFLLVILMFLCIVIGALVA